MFPPAALHVVDRLVTALMTLVCAVAPSTPIPTLPEAAAQTLFFRLGKLVTDLIRISIFGVRTPTKLDHPTPARPARPPQLGAAASLPRRPGWLLAALPEIAPAVAAEISALLADPAIATLLNRAPSLHRTLSPLLRGLNLNLNPAPPIPPPPHPPSWSNKPPPTPAQEQAANPRHHVETRPAEHPTVSHPFRFDIAIKLCV